VALFASGLAPLVSIQVSTLVTLGAPGCTSPLSCLALPGCCVPFMTMVSLFVNLNSRRDTRRTRCILPTFAGARGSAPAAARLWPVGAPEPPPRAGRRRRAPGRSLTGVLDRRAPSISRFVSSPCRRRKKDCSLDETACPARLERRPAKTRFAVKRRRNEGPKKKAERRP
jgi:hypothetical protein